MQKKKTAALHMTGIWIWTFTSLFYGFQFFLRSSPNALAPQLMEEFFIDAQTLGIFSAVYYWTYASLQIPIGMMLDIFGPKKILRLGMLVCVSGAFLLSAAPNFAVALLARCLIGAGAAVSFIGSVRMNSLWFPAYYLALVIGLLSAVGKIGGACANFGIPMLVTWMKKYNDCGLCWRPIIVILSCIGLVIAGLVWLFGKNGEDDTFTSSVSRINFKVIREQFLLVACRPTIWILGVYGYALYLTLSVFSDTFSMKFIELWLNVSEEKAGKLAALVAVGSGCGAPFLSFLSDFFKRRIVFLRLSASLVLLFSGLIFFGVSLPMWAAGVCLFAFGFFSGGQILVFVTGAETGPSQLAGLSVGLINAVLMLSGALHNPIVGYLIQSSWDGQYQGNQPLYTIGNYQTGCLAIYALFVIAFVLSFCLKESHPARHLIRVKQQG
jgi:MFS family permease